MNTAFRIRRICSLALTTVGLALCAALPLEAGKPQKSVSRPIVYFSANSSRTAWNIHRIDTGGTSDIVIREGDIGGRPRWSPNGLLIGGYYTWSGNDPQITVMNGDGTGEFVVLSESEFNEWNLSRPGVHTLKFDVRDSDNCWLGSGAHVFAGVVGYDASLFGGDPGQTVDARRLFSVDHTGAITPITEAETFDGTTLSDSDPHWSSARDAIVFVGTQYASLHVGAANELYAIRPDGTGLTQITTVGDGFRMYAPVWSPTGDRIAVSAEDPGTGIQEVWILSIDLTQPNPGTGAGGRVTQSYALKTNASAPGYPVRSSWSPDGAKILLNRTVLKSKRNVTEDQLVIVDAVSGAETVIRKTDLINAPDWNPVP